MLFPIEHISIIEIMKKISEMTTSQNQLSIGLHK